MKIIITKWYIFFCRENQIISIIKLIIADYFHKPVFACSNRPLYCIYTLQISYYSKLMRSKIKFIFTFKYYIYIKYIFAIFIINLY